MKTFAYKGYAGDGRAARGFVEAIDLKDAREKLVGQGILAESLDPAGQSRVGRRRAPRALDLDSRSSLYRELGSLLKAGLPMAQALEVLIDAPEMGDARIVLADVRDRVREGSSLADALAAASDGLRGYERAAVEVGERSGALAEVLDRLAGFLEEQAGLRDRVQTALIYPAVVLAAVILVVIFLLGVMMPRFAAMFADARIEVPAITRAVLASGRIGRTVLIFGLPALAALAVWFRRQTSASPDLRVRLDRLLLRLPLFGRGYTALVNLRFARTLALLLEGGVSLVEGIVLAGRATGSEWVATLAERESEALRHGSSLADAVRRIPPLGESLPGWIQAGEAGGNLAELLEKAAVRYQQRWERIVGRSVQALEPALILVVGIIVLVIALSILIPVLSLNETLM